MIVIAVILILIEIPLSPRIGVADDKLLLWYGTPTNRKYVILYTK